MLPVRRDAHWRKMEGTMTNNLPDTTGLNASLVYDAAEAMHPDEDIRNRIAGTIAPIGSPAPVIGPVWTMRLTRAPGTSAENRLRIMQAYDGVPAGVVLVIQAVGDLGGAVIGDVLAHRLKMSGVLGIVVDGPVRDVDGMVKYGPGSWSSAVNMAGMKTVSTMVETQVEIEIGGVRVSPGDIVAADADGVMFHPAGEAVPLLEKAVAFAKAEQQSHERIAAGNGAATSYLPKK
jgi:regulator of RNase E activity RraA